MTDDTQTQQPAKCHENLLFFMQKKKENDRREKLTQHLLNLLGYLFKEKKKGGKDFSMIIEKI